MRKLIVAGLVGLSLLAAPSAKAGGFILGMVVASMMSSGSHTLQADMPNVLYVMDRVAERVTDPLGMRTGTMSIRDMNGITIRGAFKKMFEAAGRPQADENHEILQVLRVSHEGTGGIIYLWFTYIEKDKLVPIEKLPKLAQQVEQK
ncbi:MAG: hypothetical protein V4474_04485 [Patescibacteria group bacterium]